MQLKPQPEATRAVRVPLSLLRAAAVLASPGDVRTYLDAVLVDVRHDGARIVATDGHVMGAFFTRAAPVIAGEENAADYLPEPAERLPKSFVPWTCLVPLHVIKALPKARRYAYDDWATVERHTAINTDPDPLPHDAKSVYTGSITAGAARLTFDQEQGKFPDYVRAMPALVDPKKIEAAHFDFALLARFAAVVRALGRNSALVSMSPMGPVSALVGIEGEDFAGVIMPLRTESITPLLVRPDWLRTGEA